MMFFESKDQAIRAVKNNVHFSIKAFKAFRDDREVVLEAVSVYGPYLEHASMGLRDNEEIVACAVRNEGFSIEFASERLKSKKEMVLLAVEENGWALQFVDEKLRSDKEVVFAAVVKDKDAIKFASQQIQDMCKNQDILRVLKSLMIFEQMTQKIDVKAEDYKRKQKI